MKNIITFTALAITFTLISCNNNAANETNSYIDKLADCTCETINNVFKLQKEAEDATDEKKLEIADKIESMGEPACMKNLEVDAKKIKTLKGSEAEMKAKLDTAIQKKCGAALRELNKE